MVSITEKRFLDALCVGLATKFFSFGDAAVEMLADGPKLGWLLARWSSLVGEGLRGD